MPYILTLHSVPIMDYVWTHVKLGELNVLHDVVMVEILLIHVILGVDFLQQRILILDLT